MYQACTLYIILYYLHLQFLLTENTKIDLKLCMNDIARSCRTCVNDRRLVAQDK